MDSLLAKTFLQRKLFTLPAKIFNREDKIRGCRNFSEAIYRVMTGGIDCQKSMVKLVEAMVVASVDHGVTPPSTQSTIIAASARASYEVALANGINSITDVHGGAGEKAAIFFRECVTRVKKEGRKIREGKGGY